MKAMRTVILALSGLISPAQRSSTGGRAKSNSLSFILSLSICGALQAAQPKVECSDFQTKMIYHSPETPGYTSWVGLGKTPDGKLLVSFLQQTGKPPAVKGESIVLESSDVGKTWAPVKPDGYVGFQRVCAILPDGTIVQGVGPSGSDSGYILRSSDRGRTWGKRIDFVDPKRFKAWLGVIKPLLDGRLVLFAGVLERDPANPDANNNARMAKNMFVSADGGKSWSKPMQLMKIEEGVCEESDFCELPNSDLFWIHRSEHFPDHSTEMSPLAAKMGPNPPESYWYSDRMQSVVRREGNTFIPGKCEPAPFRHSGYPTVLYTKEGLIMHLATDGIYWSADVGKTWNKLDNPATAYGAGTYYYPIAMQMDDGEIIVIGHRGWDDVYGTVDQAIMQQRFRLRVTR
jgi:hypothetical protein